MHLFAKYLIATVRKLQEKRMNPGDTLSQVLQDGFGCSISTSEIQIYKDSNEGISVNN